MHDDRSSGYVYQPPESRYFHMQFFWEGKRVRRSTKQESREAAEAVLKAELEKLRSGDTVPEEDRLTLAQLFKLVEDNYKLRRNRSIATMRYCFKHLTQFFGERAKATRLGARLEDYVEHRRTEGAAEASIRTELALLNRGYRLAVAKRLLSPRSRPEIEKPAEDESRVRKGFITRTQLETLCRHLPPALADIVTFLFWSAWRVGEARTLEWRDYDRAEQVIRLRAEQSKNKRDRVLPLTGELAAVIARRLEERKQHPECRFIFHRDGQRIGDFRKVWTKACKAAGLEGRIVHDLRRSGVKHLIGAGIDPHTAMAFSGHRTESMLRRYHIVDLDSLRRAAERSADYQGPTGSVTPLQPQNSHSEASTGSRS
jgi:integrase